MFTLALLVLLTSLLGIVYRRDRGRVFWVGFALFGWCYMVAVFGPWCNVHIAPRLLSTHGIMLFQPDSSDRGIRHSTTSPLLHAGEYGPVFIRDVPPGRPWLARVNTIYFQQIGHCVFLPLLGIISGGLACYLHAKQRKPRGEDLGHANCGSEF